MDSTASAKPNRLLLQARQGDAVALGELLEHFRNYLELLARLEIGRRLQTKVDTADLVQETFLEAHRNFKTFRGSGEAEFVAWLRGIFALRISLMLRHYLGTQGRDVRREQGLEINLDQTSQLLQRGLSAAGNSPSQSVVRREQGVRLAQALAALPDDYREIVVLRHLEDIPFAEAATRMNRSVDSVQKLWVRALAKLKMLLCGEE
jgi:RNA polymerase sigma-70 factor (ECF subfamily)